MRILLYSDHYLDPSGFGKEIKDLIPEFLKAGHEVCQVALRYSGLPPQKTIIPLYPTRITGVRSHWAPEVLDYAVKHFQPDIVFTLQDYFVLPFLVPVLSKPTKKPFKWVHWGLADGEPVAKKAVQATAWIHYQIFHSQFAKDAIEDGLKRWVRADADLSKNEIIFPAIDLNTFYPMEKERIKKEIKVDKRFVVFFLARNQTRKNTPCLMEAVKKLSKVITNIQILIHSLDTMTAALTPEGFDLASLVRYLDMEEYIAEVKGETGKAVSPGILNKLYNASDIFALPTMGEGFGLIFQEAMATGLPCISTNYSAIPEVLADGRGMLVNPCAHIYLGGETKQVVVSSDDMANAIFKLWENPVLRKKISDKGLLWVKNYTPPLVADKILNIFEKVIKEDSQPLAVQ